MKSKFAIQFVCLTLPLILIGCGSDSANPSVMIVNGFEIKPFADLSGANLVNADLTSAKLTGANLTGTNLSYA